MSCVAKTDGEALIGKAKVCGRVAWTVWNIYAAAISYYIGLGAKPIDDEFLQNHRGDAVV